MRTLGKRVWSTVVVVSVIMSIIGGLPVIQEIADRLPGWLHDTQVWWTSFWIVIGAAALCIIWKPHRSDAGEPEQESSHPDFARINAIMSNTKFAVERFIGFDREKETDALNKFVFDETHIRMPALLHSLFGKRAQDDFDQAIAKAELLSGNDSSVVFDVYLAHCGAFCVDCASKANEKIRLEFEEAKRTRLVEPDSD